MATQLAPGLARKVKKVLETRADTPETIACLKGLSEFYGENTPAARRGARSRACRTFIPFLRCEPLLKFLPSTTRLCASPLTLPPAPSRFNPAGLRSSIERRGLDINREFLEASGQAQEALAVVDAQLEGLLSGCRRIANVLDKSRERTGNLLDETARFNNNLAKIEERKKMLETFLVDYQLTDEEISALRTDDQITENFFSALARVQEIHGNCRQLLRTHHQRAGLELMDVMASYQENAHERLARWVQGECKTLAEEDGPDVPDLLTRAMTALKSRPVLHRYCIEEVSRTRHNALFRRFISALTKGGPGGVPRPIEVHATDPRRYAGDMLGWLHQAAAGEKELVAALLATEGDDGDEEKNGDEEKDGDKEKNGGEEHKEGAGVDEEEEAADPEAVLDRILEGVCRPFKVRLEQALNASPTALVAYQLANLLDFYRETLGAIVGKDASLVATVEECRASAARTFEDQISRRAAKLREKPTRPPDTLAPPPFVAETVSLVRELLQARSDAVSGGDLDETYDAVGAVLDPAVEACERGAGAIAEALRPEESGGAGPTPATTNAAGTVPPAYTARWAKEAYLLNCLNAMAAALGDFPGASAARDSLNSRVASLADTIADDEAGRILRSSGVAEVRELIALYQGQRTERGAMSRDPALELGVVGSALDKLVDEVSASPEPVPAFDEVLNPRTRVDLRGTYVGKIIEAYTLVYMAVLDPNNGYRDAKSAIRHGPDALGVLLN